MHSRFAPSSADRVCACPASLRLNEGHGDRGSSDAAQGTLAHFIAHEALKGRDSPEQFLDSVWRVTSDGECFPYKEGIADEEGDIYELTVDREMVDAVFDYLEYVEAFPGADYFFETVVDITPWTPELNQFGTLDHAAASIGTLVITDFKFGRVKVEARENFQLVLYALGFFRLWDWLYNFQRIILRIAQPRLDNFDVWEITRRELEDYGRHISERFALAVTRNPPYGAAVKSCNFCRVAGRCPALVEATSGTAALAYDDLEERWDIPVDALSNEELYEAYKLVPLIRIRLKAVEQELLRAMLNGVKIGELKVVQSLTHRKFIDPAKVIEFYSARGFSNSQLYETKLRTPASLEKLLPPKDRIIADKLARKPAGRPCVVDERDKRKSIDETALAAFAADFETDVEI